MRLQSISRTVIPLVLCLLYGRTVAAEGYWIFDGRSLTLVQRDPSSARATEWAAFYFRKAAPAGTMSQRWGIDTASGPAAVLKKVQANQKFERYYEKWCGCSWGQDTFFNVVAPVALEKPSGITDFLSARQNAGASKLHEAWDTVTEYRDRFNQAADLVGGQKLAYFGSGPVAEFMNNMHETLDKFLSLSDQLMRPATLSQAILEKNIDRFIEASSRTPNNAKAALRLLPVASSVSAVSTTLSCGPRCRAWVSGDVFHRETTHDSSSGGTFTVVTKASVADLDFARNDFLTISKDGSGYLKLVCRTDVDGNLPNCLGDQFSSGEENAHWLTTVSCDSATECRAFVNGLRQAASLPPLAETRRDLTPASPAASATARNTESAVIARTPSTSNKPAPSSSPAPTAKNASTASNGMRTDTPSSSKSSAVAASPGITRKVASAAMKRAAGSSSNSTTRRVNTTPKGTAATKSASTATEPPAASPAASKTVPTKSKAQHASKTPTVRLESHTVRIGASSLGYVRVRKSPDSSAIVVGEVRPGERYNVTKVSNGWYYIDGHGWVAGKYIVVAK